MIEISAGGGVEDGEKGEKYPHPSISGWTPKTLADLDGSETIGTAHLSETLQYRSLDRKFGLR